MTSASASWMRPPSVNSKLVHARNGSASGSRDRNASRASFSQAYWEGVTWIHRGEVASIIPLGRTLVTCTNRPGCRQLEPPLVRVRTTSPKPPLCSSSSAHASASTSPSGRSRSGPRVHPSAVIVRAPSIQAARSPRAITALHAERSTALEPPPGAQDVSRPRGRPEPGSSASSAPMPVGMHDGVAAWCSGSASGKRCSIAWRSAWSGEAMNRI